MRVRAVLRFCTVCVICFTVLIYNIGININLKSSASLVQAEQTFFTPVLKEQSEQKEEKSEEKTDFEENNKTEKTEVQSEETVETSAEAIKGKILEKYISPYKASLSYNNVYMKNSTDLKIDIKSFLDGNISFKIEQNKEPQVLIIHTHTTETFMTDNTDYYTENFVSRSRDNSKNMAKIGDIVSEKLNSAGIKTLHDSTQHDYPNYSGSYSRSAQTINSYLKKYPSIKVVLDLHRDAVSADNGDKTKLTTVIDGKKAAQVMIVMGSQSGNVTNFPNWKENLKLAVKLQQILEVKYPTLARPLSLNSKNYNQSLTTGSLLIEFGTDVNTLEEACYSAELVGNALVQLLNSLG